MLGKSLWRVLHYIFCRQKAFFFTEISIHIDRWHKWKCFRIRSQEKPFQISAFFKIFFIKKNCQKKDETCWLFLKRLLSVGEKFWIRISWGLNQDGPSMPKLFQTKPQNAHDDCHFSCWKNSTVLPYLYQALNWACMWIGSECVGTHKWVCISILIWFCGWPTKPEYKMARLNISQAVSRGFPNPLGFIKWTYM